MAVNAWPVMLAVQDRRCVIVGGGPVATRRAESLLAAGAMVVVIAPQFDSALDLLDVQRIQRPFQPDDLAGAFLVVIATNSADVNAAVAEQARRLGILINRTDAPGEGDFSVPAHAHHGPVTIAVHTDGISAAAAARIRRELSDQLDPDWPVLLDAAAPHRARIQQQENDPERRQASLRKLTDDHALHILKEQGVQQLRVYYDTLLDPPESQA